MDEEEDVHAFHTRLQSRPRGAFDGFVDEGVLGNDELGFLRQRPPELLELLDGEAVVLDGGKEVAVLELFFHGLDCFFLLGAADGGADCGGIGGSSVGV